MTEIMLQSKASGSWAYEVLEDKIKVQYKIVFGLNKIPEDHMKVLKRDPFFKAMIKKEVYLIPKPVDLRAAEKAEENKLSGMTDADKIKVQWKQEVADLKEVHAKDTKEKQVSFNAKEKQLVESRAASLNQVSELTDEVKRLKGDMALADAHLEKELSKLQKLIEALEKDKEAMGKDKEALEEKLEAARKDKQAVEKKLKELAAKK